MGIPYLNSGETIILTTDRVIAGDGLYDVILTSQRLALVDSGHTREQPQVIPFTTILSVKGGMTPAREPGIMLLLADTGNGAGLKDITLVFSQQPYEDRAPERDRWMKTLIEHIVRFRQGSSPYKERPAAETGGIQPLARRGIAPEIPQPHADVTPVQKQPSKEALTEIQETAWEAPIEGQTREEAQEDMIPVADEVPNDTKNVTAEDVQENLVPAAEEVLADKEKEEETPEKVQDDSVPASGVLPAGREVEAGSYNTGTPATIESDEYLAAMEGEGEWATEEEPEMPLAPAVPEAEGGTSVGAGSTVDERSAVTAAVRIEGSPAINAPEPSAGIPPAVPEIRTGLPDHVVFPVISLADSEEHPASGIPEEAPRELTPAPAAGGGDETHPVPTGLPHSVGFPVIMPREPETLPESHAAPSPLPAPRLQRDTIIVVAAIAIILILIAGVAFVGFPYFTEKNTGVAGPTITPAPAAVQPSAAPAVVIPATGVWVRVVYNGTYAGSVGNAGDLRLVSGTGDQFYVIRDSSGLVQATFQKQDQGGDTLTVGVYTNGTEVTYRTVRAPRGTISILVDPRTGKPPYVPAVTPQ
jgi:hypothetical protein